MGNEESTSAEDDEKNLVKGLLDAVTGFFVTSYTQSIWIIQSNCMAWCNRTVYAVENEEIRDILPIDHRMLTWTLLRSMQYALQARRSVELPTDAPRQMAAPLTMNEGKR